MNLKPKWQGLIAVIAFSLTPAHAASPLIHTLRYPGSQNTLALGIDGETIVGMYWDEPSITHGFIYDGTTYRTLDVPGSVLTGLFDVEGSRIVGYYRNESTPLNGFLYDGSMFVDIHPPGTALNIQNGTSALGISGGKIVGGYYAEQNDAFGYIYDGSSYTNCSFPRGIGALRGIDRSNIVGAYFADGRTHGLHFDGSTSRTIDHPAGVRGTDVEDIDGSTLVGTYTDGDSALHGFLLFGGQLTQFTNFDVPASLGRDTNIEGVSGSTIVGYYFSSDGIRGFVATVPEPSSFGMAVIVYQALVTVSRRTRHGISRHHHVGRPPRP